VRYLLFSLLPVVLFGQPRWVSFDGTPNATPPKVEIVSGDRSGVRFKVEIPGMLVDEKTVNGVEYQTITL
jgi:hypothetical protein